MYICRCSTVEYRRSVARRPKPVARVNRGAARWPDMGKLKIVLESDESANLYGFGRAAYDCYDYDCCGSRSARNPPASIRERVASSARRSSSAVGK